MHPLNWTDRGWNAITRHDLRFALPVPSMLSHEESQLYHWLGRQAEGCGAVVDLGAFAGGSAARLLSGLELGPGTAGLHAYDRFTADPRARKTHLYPHGVPETDSNDILPLAQGFLSRWQDRVTLQRGDIAKLDWPPAPVEILAMDAGKSPQLTDHVAQQFFPHLIPGRSVLIQQDFLHVTQPWLAVQMQALRDHFVPVAFVPRDCVVFLCTKAVTPAAVQAAATTGLTDAAMIAALKTAAQAFAPLVPARRIKAMIPKLRANPGVRVAWKMVN